jgi:hypothetical protein
VSFELSFQESFDASFRLSFEVSYARSDDASFEMSDGRSYEVSFRVSVLRCFPANSEASFLASFQGAIKGILDFRLMNVDWRTAEADFTVKTQRHEEVSDSPHLQSAQSANIQPDLCVSVTL